MNDKNHFYTDIQIHSAANAKRFFFGEDDDDRPPNIENQKTPNLYLRREFFVVMYEYCICSGAAAAAIFSVMKIKKFSFCW